MCTCTCVCFVCCVWCVVCVVCCVLCAVCMCVCACVRVCVCKTDRRHSASDVFDNVLRTIDMHRVHKATEKKKTFSKVSTLAHLLQNVTMWRALSHYMASALSASTCEAQFLPASETYSQDIE